VRSWFVPVTERTTVAKWQQVYLPVFTNMRASEQSIYQPEEYLAWLRSKDSDSELLHTSDGMICPGKLPVRARVLTHWQATLIQTTLSRLEGWANRELDPSTVSTQAGSRTG
jgi:hypothetical protein